MLVMVLGTISSRDKQAEPMLEGSQDVSGTGWVESGLNDPYGLLSSSSCHISAYDCYIGRSFIRRRACVYLQNGLPVVIALVLRHVAHNLRQRRSLVQFIL